MPTPYTYTPAAPAASTEAAAHRRMQAERTQEPEALKPLSRQAAAAAFRAHNERATAATQREATRLEAIGPAGREDERQAAYHYATR